MLGFINKLRNRKKICKFRNHVWKNDNGFPVHGYYDMPNDGSYCTRCGFVYHAKVAV